MNEAMILQDCIVKEERYQISVSELDLKYHVVTLEEIV